MVFACYLAQWLMFYFNSILMCECISVCFWIINRTVNKLVTFVDGMWTSTAIPPGFCTELGSCRIELSWFFFLLCLYCQMKMKRKHMREGRKTGNADNIATLPPAPHSLNLPYFTAWRLGKLPAFDMGFHNLPLGCSQTIQDWLLCLVVLTIIVAASI